MIFFLFYAVCLLTKKRDILSQNIQHSHLCCTGANQFLSVKKMNHEVEHNKLMTQGTKSDAITCR